MAVTRVKVPQLDADNNPRFVAFDYDDVTDTYTEVVILEGGGGGGGGLSGSFTVNVDGPEGETATGGGYGGASTVDLTGKPPKALWVVVNAENPVEIDVPATAGTFLVQFSVAEWTLKVAGEEPQDPFSVADLSGDVLVLVAPPSDGSEGKPTMAPVGKAVAEWIYTTGSYPTLDPSGPDQEQFNAATEAFAADVQANKAPLASPAFAGTPTAPTATAGTNTTQIATTAFVRAEAAALVDSAPGTLDTLNELAAALGDDPGFATTITSALAGKQPLDADLTALAALTTTPIGRSLLEAANAAALRTILGLAAVASTGAYSDLTGAPAWAPRPTVPDSGLAATVNRKSISASITTAPLTSGTLYVSLLDDALPAGTTITSASFRSGTQAAVSPTNWWFCLLDASLNYVAITADQGSASWAANTVKNLPFATPYVTTSAGQRLYLGVMVAAGTVPQLLGFNSSSVVALGLSPIANGTSTTGLTTPPTLPATAGALTASTAVALGWVA